MSTEEETKKSDEAKEEAVATPPAPSDSDAAGSKKPPADGVAAAVAAEEEAAEAVELKKKKDDSEELAKRLQKLALERQKAQTGDRLKVIQSDAASHLTGAKTFQELDLPKYLLDAIFAMGFDRPSAIQEEALPRILADPPRNLIGQAQSGSGKTAAFTLGMLYRLNIDDPPSTQALCVTPTRELAIQIFQKAVKPMAANMTGLKIQLAIAGTTIERGTSLDAHLVIGTPGKVVDWLKRRIIKPNTIKVFVLDEADNMVGESGHRANSLLIKKAMPRDCQTLLFSATFPDDVVRFADKMVHKPDKILIESEESLVLDVIKQLWIDTRAYQGGKLDFLSDIYSLLTIGQSIVFVGTKKNADMVHRALSEGGYTCSVLHSGLQPDERDTTMQAFRNGESNVLITTNVLARGVDVDNVCMVINYDIPLDKDGQPDFETYLHRIGRTGRFGKKGTAISLIDDPSSIQALAAIEQHFAKPGSEMIQQADADPEKLADQIEI
ncbi:MAG: hypothetical protein SGILL_000134 [Bacillariaceae sp.]